jgi:hypothetical protein
MGHSMGTVISKKTLLIAALLLAGALIAVYGFNVSWRSLAPFGFLVVFVWMHMGGHGMHGGNHAGQSDEPPRDQHASHTRVGATDSNARALAPVSGAGPLASDTDGASEAREAPRRHGGC